MGLTDPELELLLETLDEDPSDDVLVEVAHELVRRRRWEAAVRRLQRGLRRTHGRELRALLARAQYETGHFREALATLEQLDIPADEATEAGRLLILCLERGGRAAQARDRAERYLRADPRDVVVQSVLERLGAPAPEAGRRGADPWLTVARAEQYARLGRVDRAIRVYRRILMYHLNDRGIASRLRQLSAEAARAPDDLSEELVDPSQLQGEALDLPRPKLGREAALAATPQGAMRSRGDLLEVDEGYAADEVTEVVARLPRPRD